MGAPSNEVLLAAAQADSHAGVAALTFILWDMIIHLSDEVEYIWRGANTWIKWMYLFIRHFPILAEIALLTIITSDSTGVHFSTEGCRRWIIFQAAAMEAMTLAVEIVLIIRVYALYNHNKPILGIITVMFLGEVAVMIMALCMSIPRMSFNAACLITGAPDIFMSFWLSSLAFETTLFLLTLVKFFNVVHCGLGEETITYIFFRDGTWAFAIIFVIMLLNTLMYKLNDTPLAGICYFWDLSVMSFAGSHVLLNLRRLSAGHTSTFSLFTTNIDVAFKSNDPSSFVYDPSFAHETDISRTSVPMIDM